MSKKLIAVSVAVFAIAAFSIFSFMDALALDMNSDSNMSAGTSAVKLCKQARRNYRRDIKSARAKGLREQLSKSEIRRMIRQIKSYRNQICREAREERRRARGDVTQPSTGDSTLIEISSNSFAKGAAIPVKHAFAEVPGAAGDNVSPHFAFSTARTDIKSYALLMFDPHPTAQNFAHWCVSDIPANVTSISEGASGTMSMPGVEWQTGEGAGYFGPFPPPEDDAHPYVFKLVGLNVPMLSVGDNIGLCSFASFNAAAEGKVLASGTYQGTFDR